MTLRLHSGPTNYILTIPKPIELIAPATTETSRGGCLLVVKDILLSLSWSMVVGVVQNHKNGQQNGPEDGGTKQGCERWNISFHGLKFCNTARKKDHTMLWALLNGHRISIESISGTPRNTN